MATHTEHKLIDDIDGTEASESVSFGIDGKDLTIDLSEANAARLREVLAPYVAAARRAGRHRHGSTSSRTNQTAARSWLIEHGHVVPARGRLSADLLDAYEQRRVADVVDQVSLIKAAVD